MLLPKTVHGRVTDIWRSYITQWVMRELIVRQRGTAGLPTYGRPCLMFTVPHIYHDRNVHKYIQDFNAELPLYQQTAALLNNIMSTPPVHRGRTDPDRLIGLPELMTSAYVTLYEHGVVELEDVRYATAWTSDLGAIGYLSSAFAPVPIHRQSHTGVCISFNWPPSAHGLDLTLHIHRQLHRHLAIISPVPLSDLSAPLPPDVHYIQCEPHGMVAGQGTNNTITNGYGGVLQYVCVAACADHFQSLSLRGGSAADTIDSILFQSDDMIVNYTQLWWAPGANELYPRDKAWVHALSRDRNVDLTAGEEIARGGGWWYSEGVGNIFSLRHTAEYLQQHSARYRDAWLSAFGSLTRAADKSLSDLVFLPRAQWRHYIDIINIIGEMSRTRPKAAPRSDPHHHPELHITVPDTSAASQTAAGATGLAHQIRLVPGMHFCEMVIGTIVRLAGELAMKDQELVHQQRADHVYDPYVGLLGEMIINLDDPAFVGFDTEERLVSRIREYVYHQQPRTNSDKLLAIMHPVKVSKPNMRALYLDAYYHIIDFHRSAAKATAN